MAQQAYAPFLRRWMAAVPPLRWLVWGLEAGFLALLWTGLGLLPPARASALGRRAMRALGPRLRKHRHVVANLRTALPERTPAEIEAIARESWGTVGAVLGEFPHLARIARERMEIVDRAGIEALRDAGRPIVFVTPHLGNWELTTLAVARYGIPLAVIYAPDANPWITKLVRRRRRDLDCELIPRDGGVRALLRALAAGRSVGLVVDTRQDEGEPVPFFGRDALTSTVPARLALRMGLPLVPVRVERGADARFRVTLDAPIEPDLSIADPRERARAMTLRIHERFEAWIRERPGEWMCTKRRWPKVPASAGGSAHSAPAGA